MSSYEFRYVGADSLPSRLSEFDVQQYFRLSQLDVAALNERFRTDRRAGAAVLLLFMRASGRPLDRFTALPKALLHHVGEALDIRAPTIASLRSMYARRQTLYEHQLWLKGYLGLNDVDQAASDRLVAYLSAQAGETVSVDELVVAANRWLYEQKLVIPADRQVRDLARKCYASAEAIILKLVRASIPDQTIARCRSTVFGLQGGGPMTVLEWLKNPSKRHSPSTLSETLEKIAFLKDLGAGTWAFESIPLEKQRGYAQALQARRPAKTRELSPASQTIELVFFLRITLLELTDSVIYQAGRRVSDLVRQAYDKTQVRQARSSAEYRDRLVSIKTLVDDIGRPAEERLAAIRELVADMGLPSASSHAANVRQLLTDEPARIRGLLSNRLRSQAP